MFVKEGSLVVRKRDDNVGVVEQFSRDLDPRHRAHVFVRWTRDRASWVDANDLDDLIIEGESR